MYCLLAILLMKTFAAAVGSQLLLEYTKITQSASRIKQATAFTEVSGIIIGLFFFFFASFIFLSPHSGHDGTTSSLKRVASYVCTTLKMEY